MADDLILAVGGTGQVLLHYYCQMFAIGLAPQAFRAIVFDTDRFSKSLHTFQLYFEALRAAGCPDPLPEIRSAELEGTGGVGVRIHQIMGATDLPEGGYHQPLQAFYSRSLLGLKATDGLYSRPAASPLVLEDVGRLLRETDIQQGANVLLTGSTIGGTGAGLSTQLLCRAQGLARRHTGVTLKAVWLGEYFIPDERVVENAPVRFASNKTFFLKSTEHAAPDLIRFAWIDPDRKEDKLAGRDANAELDRPHLGWTEENQPFWQGLKAMVHLLRDRAKDAPVQFVDKEVSVEQFEKELSRSVAEQVLRAGLGRASALVRHNVVVRLASEARPEAVWGAALTNSTRGYADALRRGTAGQEGDAGAFCAGVQRELATWWNGGRQDCFALPGLFPSMNERPARVEELRSVRWSAPPRDLSGPAFRNSAAACRTAAAALLDSALRKGGRA